MINQPSNIFDIISGARADYDAMRDSRHVRKRTGLAPGGGSADYHVRNEQQYLNLIEKARDLERNASIIGTSIEKAAHNVVGDGFVVCPDTGDKKLDADLYDRWTEWTEDESACDITGERTWSEMEIVSVISQIRDGDIIGIGTKDGQLQLVEGHQCRNPRRWESGSNKKNTVLGVQMNEVRKRTKYHIRTDSIDPYKTTQTEKSIAYDVRDGEGMRQLFHYYVSARSSATRGVTALSPCFQKVEMFEDLDFAKLIQAQAVSCFAIIRTREQTKHTGLPTRVTPYGNQTTEVDSDGTSRLLDELSGPMEVRAAPGEKIEGFSADVPNTNYFEHAKMLLSMFFINIGLPYVMGMMDASETNFSGWRAAMEEAKKGFRRNQRSLRDRWHRPIYHWKLAQFAADDSAIRAAQQRLKDSFFRHTWRLPKWPYIQPVEDSAAQAFRMRNGLISPRRLHGELSQDWEEIVAETIADNQFAITRAMEAANAINAQYQPSQPVHWRELMSLPTPDGINLTLPMQQPQQQPNGAPNRGN